MASTPSLKTNHDSSTGAPAPAPTKLESLLAERKAWGEAFLKAWDELEAEEKAKTPDSRKG